MIVAAILSSKTEETEKDVQSPSYDTETRVSFVKREARNAMLTDAIKPFKALLSNVAEVPPVSTYFDPLWLDTRDDDLFRDVSVPNPSYFFGPDVRAFACFETYWRGSDYAL